MKKFLVLLVLLIPLLLQAQWTNNCLKLQDNTSGWRMYWKGTLDTLTGASTYDTLTSNTFSMDDFDGNSYLDFGYKLAASGDSIQVDLLYSDYTTTAASMLAKTLVKVTLGDTLMGSTEGKSSLALQNYRSKYYRLRIRNYLKSRDDCIFELLFTLPKRDF